MSLHVWRCVCERRWYYFGKAQWDSRSDFITQWCPGCHPETAAVLNDWREL